MQDDISSTVTHIQIPVQKGSSTASNGVMELLVRKHDQRSWRSSSTVRSAVRRDPGLVSKTKFSAEEVNDSPIEQVRLTVPITDDPTLPCLTFRTWVLGTLSCAILAFLNRFFGYRQNALYISSVSTQIAALPIAKFMAAYLPTKSIQIPGTKWTFSMNPGPFNLKEHVLITIFANSVSNTVYAVGIITIVKAFYHQQLYPLAAMLLT
ncbi:hypothetical protein TEA_029471 [Camellia sinensis var. sinensis]|uniref:Oligopeptide transporter n=1 Tax=Camellia sinensis var. sinensis TaxID=542762 RepID=A0A4V3WKR5_CAMSN|nr:hypothetical protein TEA_029471 [Camellia sinensis var. sinensis]